MSGFAIARFMFESTKRALIGSGSRAGMRGKKG